jgi:hypothetical protein
MTSKIKVDNIENQCGGAVVTKCGATTTISGSVVKADDIQAADGGNLINQCGTTITLGASGDTINLASGASQTGFGRTGTVDWDTTAKTASFTAVSGNGYFVNTTSGAITVTLPASPSAGDIVYVKDYNGSFATNNCTVARNSSNIRGGTNDFVLQINNAGAVFIYVDATEGWQVFVDGSDSDVQETFISATGGTITTSGDYKIHTFTGPGTFQVNSLASCSGNAGLDYLVVAGGGSGATQHSGGGGAGGYRTSFCVPATPITATISSFPITVGGGGTQPGTGPGASAPTNPGSNSVFSTITSNGGGGGGTYPNGTGQTGGSGGGGASDSGSGGAGNTPPTPVSQGNNGGNGATHNTGGGGGGGGGGSAAVGVNAVAGPGGGAGNGGAGAQNNIDGNNYYWAGGGGGAVIDSQSSNAYAGNGGIGGGGGGANKRNSAGGAGGGSAINCGTAGGTQPSPTPSGPANGGAGGANSGGGGGGAGSNTGDAGGAGGSGIVIIRYKFQ